MPGEGFTFFWVSFLAAVLSKPDMNFLEGETEKDKPLLQTQQWDHFFSPNARPPECCPPPPRLAVCVLPALWQTEGG